MTTEQTGLHLPLPAPELPGDPCADCTGAGVTGEVYRWPSGPDSPILIVDVPCLTCRGCGRAEHDEACEAPEHHGDRELRDDDLDDDDAGEEHEYACPSCHGRLCLLATGWRTGPDSEPLDDEVLTIRVPCGCTTDRLQPVTLQDETARHG